MLDDIGSGVQGLGLVIWVLRFRVSGVEYIGFRVRGLGFRSLGGLWSRLCISGLSLPTHPCIRHRLIPSVLI